MKRHPHSNRSTHTRRAIKPFNLCTHQKLFTWLKTGDSQNKHHSTREIDERTKMPNIWQWHGAHNVINNENGWRCYGSAFELNLLAERKCDSERNEWMQVYRLWKGFGGAGLEWMWATMVKSGRWNWTFIQKSPTIKFIMSIVGGASGGRVTEMRAVRDDASGHAANHFSWPVVMWVIY